MSTQVDEISSTSITEILPQYQSDDSDNDAEEIEQPTTSNQTKRKRGVGRKYEIYKEFETAAAARDHIKSIDQDEEPVWNKVNKNETGSKHYYACKKSNCKKRLYIYYPEDNNKAIIYISQDLHSHLKKSKEDFQKKKKLVMDVHQAGAKTPNMIIDQLEKQHQVVDVEKIKMKNFLAYQKKKSGNAIVFLNDSENVVIEIKPKRGAPAKAKKDLIKQ